jgi:hypothetical protein
MKTQFTMEDDGGDIAWTRGERALLLNIILRALADLNHGGERKDAFEWLTCDASADVEWSFRWCCSNLGFSNRVTEGRIRKIKDGFCAAGMFKRRRRW